LVRKKWGPGSDGYFPLVGLTGQLPAGMIWEKMSTGWFCLDEETALGREPENDLAAGFSSVEIALGEEDPDAGPDAAFAVGRVQHVNVIGYVAALLLRHGLEDCEMGGRRFKDFRSLIGNFLHSFHNSSW
jgi:hypothetical protein